MPSTEISNTSAGKAGSRSGRTRRPETPAKVLSWIYLGRIGVAFALVLRLPGGTLPPEYQAAIMTALLVATTIVTTGSYLYTHSWRKRPGTGMLYGQVLFDALLLTGIVYATGGHLSIYAPLYILVITAGALLLPFLGGIAVGLLTSVLYLAAAVAHAAGPDVVMLLQTALFAIVAVAIGWVGDRLRQTRTALGEVETELRRLRLDTNDILESIGTGILTVDEHSHLAYLNPAASELLSLRKADWLDKPVLEELDRIAPGLGRVIERTAITRTPIRRYETDPGSEDGLIFGVSTTLVERTGGGRPPVTVIFQNITEKKRLEELRRRAERLESLAELSASLAHEIKNPLASIRSGVEQITSDRVDPEDAFLLGRVIVRETDRVSRLLGEFLDFARVKVVAPESVDLAGIAKAVVEVLKAHPDVLENGVTVSYKGPAEPVYTRGDGDLLHRAVFNLVLNGAQWAGEEGAVTVTLEETRSDLLSPALGALRLVRLAVRDTGPGVPETIRESIFDPFFTRRQGGTGLGLALVQRAVEAHGGAIFVDRASGRKGGAVFSLYLPTLPTEFAEIGATSNEQQVA